MVISLTERSSVGNKSRRTNVGATNRCHSSLEAPLTSVREYDAPDTPHSLLPPATSTRRPSRRTTASSSRCSSETRFSSTSRDLGEFGTEENQEKLRRYYGQKRDRLRRLRQSGFTELSVTQASNLRKVVESQFEDDSESKAFETIGRNRDKLLKTMKHFDIFQEGTLSEDQVNASLSVLQVPDSVGEKFLKVIPTDVHGRVMYEDLVDAMVAKYSHFQSEEQAATQEKANLRLEKEQLLSRRLHEEVLESYRDRRMKMTQSVSSEPGSLRRLEIERKREASKNRARWIGADGVPHSQRRPPSEPKPHRTFTQEESEAHYALKKILTTSVDNRFKRFRKAFTTFDQNKEGHVTREGMLRTCQNLNIPCSENTVDVLFEKAGIANDAMSYDQFKKEFERNEEEYDPFERFRFKRGDQRKKRFTWKEQEGISSAKRKVQQYLERNADFRKEFVKMDLNHSGNLDKSEFKQALKGTGVGDKDIDLLFDMRDRDASSEIDYTEFIKFIEEPDNKSQSTYSSLSRTTTVDTVKSHARHKSLFQPHLNIFSREASRENTNSATISTPVRNARKRTPVPVAEAVSPSSKFAVGEPPKGGVLMRNLAYNNAKVVSDMPANQPPECQNKRRELEAGGISADRWEKLLPKQSEYEKNGPGQKPPQESQAKKCIAVQIRAPKSIVLD